MISKCREAEIPRFARFLTYLWLRAERTAFLCPLTDNPETLSYAGKAPAKWKHMKPHSLLTGGGGARWPHSAHIAGCSHDDGVSRKRNHCAGGDSPLTQLAACSSVDSGLAHLLTFDNPTDSLFFFF